MSAAMGGPGMITPEAVFVDLPIAGLGSRGLARAFDTLVQLVVLIMVAGFLGAVAAQSGSSTLLVVVVLLGFFVAVFVYPILFESIWRGRTPGKAVVGIRVVTSEGSPIGVRHAVVRGVVGLLELPTGIAVASMLCTRKQVRIGDLAAGTIVLRERSTVSAGSSPITFVPPPGCEGLAMSLDLSGVTQGELEMIRSFLVRVGELEPARRRALAVRLATPIALRQRFPIPDWASPELVLVCAMALWQLRSGYHNPGAPLA